MKWMAQKLFPAVLNMSVWCCSAAVCRVVSFSLLGKCACGSPVLPRLAAAVSDWWQLFSTISNWRIQHMEEMPVGQWAPFSLHVASVLLACC